MNFAITLKHMHSRLDLVYGKIVQEQKIILLQHTTYLDVLEEYSKTNCKAKIYVITYGDGKCTISRVFLEHNHALSPKKSCFQQSHKKMDSYAKIRLELNDYVGIPLNKNFHSLVVEVEGYVNLLFGKTDCRSYIVKVRQLSFGLRDAEALRNFFLNMQKKEFKFFST
uniref:Protein FAR1-RELATED SEQUENCE n=1 Tax=Lactuca sativa TaxID=4236 RepID=A0A9R1UF22_LACSA|nr:hypothetical protein LSAT_V11C900465130 [Lactuca sativa]